MTNNTSNVNCDEDVWIYKHCTGVHSVVTFPSQ